MIILNTRTSRHAKAQSRFERIVKNLRRIFSSVFFRYVLMVLTAIMTIARLNKTESILTYHSPYPYARPEYFLLYYTIPWMI